MNHVWQIVVTPKWERWDPDEDRRQENTQQISVFLNLACWKHPFTGYQKTYTLPKFNSSPLKNAGWKTTLLLRWYIFRGELLNFQGDILCAITRCYSGMWTPGFTLVENSTYECCCCVWAIWGSLHFCCFKAASCSGHIWYKNGVPIERAQASHQWFLPP